MRIKLLISAFFICICSIYAKNSALVIGIGNYNTEATGWLVIHGNNDVDYLERKLRKKGFSVITLTDRLATKSNIKDALNNLVVSTASGDTVYVHFSGHGQRIKDVHGQEKDGYNESFICYDAYKHPNFKVGYRGENHFIDDELFQFINQLKVKVGITGMIVLVMDTCYSGGADRSEKIDDQDSGTDSEVEWEYYSRGSNVSFPVNKNTETYLRTIKKPHEYANGGKLIFISACKNEEKAYECKERATGRKYGSLSFCIGKMLDNNIPMSKWSNYFVNQKYRPLEIFRPTQHPEVKSYK